ncbi:MAG: mandelate racemase/muconate lactonizing enzyme family protein [Candidatus Berkelbacteria bacterium]
MAAKIIDVKIIMVAINLSNPFNLGFGTLTTLPRVFLKLIADDGGKIFEGVGEASIDFPFSSYDAWDIYWSLCQFNFEGWLVDDRVKMLACVEEKIGEFPAALAAFNMAIDDLYGKVHQLSIIDIYGQVRSSGVVLSSIPFLPIDQTIAKAKEVISKMAVPKIKTGVDIDSDVAMINTMESLVAETRSRYAVDFNGSYSFDEFIQFLNKLCNSRSTLSGLCWAEQPISANEGIDALGLAAVNLKMFGNIPVIADESFVTEADAKLCLGKNIWLNFKIQKIGGIAKAKLIESANWDQIIKTESMVGGTFPSAIGRVYDQQAASVLHTANLASDGWEPSTNWFDGEKHFITERFQFNAENGQSLPMTGSGLGVNIIWGKINSFRIINPQAEYRKIRSDESGNRIQIQLKNNASYARIYKKKSGKAPDWNLGG